jgi:hypothetical protein
VDDNPAEVRGSEEHLIGDRIQNVVKVKVRLDVELEPKKIRWSVVAWKHPQAELIRNELGSQDEEHRIDEEIEVMCQAIWTIVEDSIGPFPTQQFYKQ